MESKICDDAESRGVRDDAEKRTAGGDASASLPATSVKLAALKTEPPYSIGGRTPGSATR